MSPPLTPATKSKPPTSWKMLGISMVVLLAAMLSADDKTHTQNVSSDRDVPLTSHVLPSEWDLSEALNANEAGLVANSDKDQSKQLAAVIAMVEADPNQTTVYVPEGHYRIASTIRLRPGVNLIGDGKGRTVFYRDDDRDYLVKGGARGDFGQTLVAGMSFRNSKRTLLMVDVHQLRFHNVEFEGGIVRFERSSKITIEACYFNRNLGKGGYAGSACSHMRIVYNRFLSTEKGSINLSGHQDSYIGYNHITADKLIDSGYAGIRLPNTAKNNLVEHNYIENHGRGLFVLTYSSHNTLRHNTIKSSKYQGILVQSPHNVLEHNVIIDAGLAAIRVSDAYGEKVVPSFARDNQVLHNIITDTRKANRDTQVGMVIISSNTTVEGNVIDRRFGRSFMNFREDQDNTKAGNIYR